MLFRPRALGGDEAARDRVIDGGVQGINAAADEGVMGIEADVVDQIVQILGAAGVVRGGRTPERLIGDRGALLRQRHGKIAAHMLPQACVGNLRQAFIKDLAALLGPALRQGAEVGVVAVAHAGFDEASVDEGIGVDGLGLRLLTCQTKGGLADILDRLADTRAGFGDLLTAARIRATHHSSRSDARPTVAAARRDLRASEVLA